MKERQRWTSEEDAILGAYVRQYGAREWHLLPQRMNVTIDRDAKSCLERWKNYLKPGIKRGSLTEEEQRLVICLQAKHGNKWKRIASEVPGRTAKRLGKWWEVYKEKLERAKKESTKSLEPVEEGKYDRILETFAEKLVKEIDSNRPTASGFLMGMSNGGFLHGDQVHSLPQTQMLPPWLSASTAGPPLSPSTTSTSPSVTLSLASATAPNSVPWLRPERVPAPVDNGGEQMMLVSELMCCCRELEEGHRALSAHKKEAAWRLNRVELQLEAEKASRRREKAEEIEAKIRALKEEEKVSFERIEAEYREQLAALRRDAEVKEQKLADRWSAKHMRITNLLEQISHRNRLSEQN